MRGFCTIQIFTYAIERIPICISAYSIEKQNIFIKENQSSVFFSFPLFLYGRFVASDNITVNYMTIHDNISLHQGILPKRLLMRWGADDMRWRMNDTKQGLDETLAFLWFECYGWWLVRYLSPIFHVFNSHLRMHCLAVIFACSHLIFIFNCL